MTQDDMTTLRKELDYAKFDWETGKIIIINSYGIRKYLDISDMPLLDAPFYCGYGYAQIPHFRAEDKDYIYFPYEYDGATCVKRVHKVLDKYLDESEDLDCI